MAASPESENQLLRSVLASVAEGKADAAHVACALNDTDAAQKAFREYRAAQDEVVAQVRAFLEGRCDDTRPLERAFDRLMAMRGENSGDRADACGPGKGHRPRRSRR